MIKISTITPCYKMGEYLPVFLKELKKQTIFPNFEVVLDHNDPEDWEIDLVNDFIKKYPPGVIKHIITKPVDSIGVSMNRCIKESSGEFLTIWNVDDLRTNDSLEKQSNVLIDNLEIDIVNSNYQVVNMFGIKNGRQIDHTIYPEEEYKRGMILGPFFMFRKKICEKCGFFDEQLKTGADFDFAIRLAYNGKIKFTNGNIGFYLDAGRGASTRQGSLQELEKTVILLRYEILDKIKNENCERFLEEAKLKYDIDNIINFGKKYNYKKFL